MLGGHIIKISSKYRQYVCGFDGHSSKASFSNFTRAKALPLSQITQRLLLAFIARKHQIKVTNAMCHNISNRRRELQSPYRLHSTTLSTSSACSEFSCVQIQSTDTAIDWTYCLQCGILHHCCVSIGPKLILAPLGTIRPVNRRLPFCNVYTWDGINQILSSFSARIGGSFCSRQILVVFSSCLWRLFDSKYVVRY